MDETRAIIEAFDAAKAGDERCALATVVSVEGSAYRRPGARMLVRESDASTGTISAGCLERDVAEHARGVIESNQSKLVEYDTTSTSDEMAWGLGLGCNGTVRVLVEPLTAQSIYIAALRRTLTTGSNVVIVATVFRNSPSRAAMQALIGSRLCFSEDEEILCDISNGELAAMIERDARAAAREEMSGGRVYETASGTIEVFIETITPSVSLIIFGAGHDALPIVEMARGLGWHTEIIDLHARPITCERFANAGRVTLARPESIAEQVKITSRSLTIVMTHDYAYDRETLKHLLASPAQYIGVMGPKKRLARMLEELAESDSNFKLEETDRARLYAPVGLDIGASTPPEIALSVIAEMRAAVAGREGGHLRRRHAPIHDAQTASHQFAPGARDTLQPA